MSDTAIANNDLDTPDKVNTFWTTYINDLLDDQSVTFDEHTKTLTLDKTPTVIFTNQASPTRWYYSFDTVIGLTTTFTKTNDFDGTVPEFQTSEQLKDKIQSVFFGPGVTQVGAFRDVPELTTVDFTGCTSLATIKQQAFKNCSAITTVKLTGCTSLATIKQQAFKNCSALTTLDLSDTIWDPNLVLANDRFAPGASALRTVVLNESLINFFATVPDPELPWRLWSNGINTLAVEDNVELINDILTLTKG